MAAAETDLVFYPRAFVGLSTTLEGTDEVDTGIVPTRVSIVRRSHSQAGSAEITIHGSAMPFDPRQVGGIFVSVFLGAVDTVDADVNQEEFLRFVGFTDEMKTTRDEKGPVVELAPRDLSSLLRDFKPLPASAVPKYSDTIEAAINRILDAVDNLNNPDGSKRLTLKTVSGVTDRQLSTRVGSRASSSAVRLPPDATAWQAVEHICGLMSLLVSVRLNEIVVRTPADAFEHNRPTVASFVFGGDTANLLSVHTEKKFARNRKGVKVTAYDPITRTRLEGVYPPDGDLRSLRRPRAHVGGTALRSTSHRSSSRGSSSGSSAAANAQAALATERDVFTAPFGTHTNDACRDYAQRIYTERSRQEIEGKIITPIWIQDWLAIENGDRFSIDVDPDLSAELRNTTSDQARVDLLTQRLDVTEDAARALIRASTNTPTDHWYARTITHEFASDGRCTTTIDYLNLITIEN
jgi:hypothetical protein